jgi:predicted PurR-regulated permease PerM
VIGLLLGIGAFYLLFVLKGVLLPFFIAWMLSYFLQPLVRFFQCRLRIRNRMFSVLLVLLSFALLIALIVMLVRPSIQGEIERFTQLIDQYDLSDRSIPFIPEQWVDFIREWVDFKEIETVLTKENLLQLAKEYLPEVVSGTMATITAFTVIFLTLLYLFFILLDYEKLAKGWINLIPDKFRPVIVQLGEEIGQNMNRYFRGQALIASLVGVFLALGFNIIGLPLGIVLGLFIGLLNMVPYLQVVGVVPMVLLCLLKTAETGQNFWIILALASLVMVIVQFIQDIILTPRIMGKAMGLNPAIILLSLSIWGTLLGFVGLIIALPLTVISETYYRRFILMEEEIPESKPDKPVVKNPFKKQRQQ